MFNRKKLVCSKSKTIKFRFDEFFSWGKGDDGVQKFTQTNECYNYCISSGALKVGHGFKKLALPAAEDPSAPEEEFEIEGSEILGFWPVVWYNSHAKKDEYYIFYIDETKSLHFFDVYGDKFIYPGNVTFNEIPAAVQFSINDGSDAIFFSSERDKTRCYTSTGSQELDELPQFVSGCWHGNYLFMVTAGDKNKLSFSDNTFDMWLETEVKDVPLPAIRGGMTQVVSLGDELYLFREFGISRLTLYSTRSEIASSQIYYSSAYIQPQTIAKSGDEVIFLSDGLYHLDGANVKKFDSPVFDKIDYDHCVDNVGICYNGCYYLACRYRFDDEEYPQHNNALIIFNIDRNEAEVVRGVDIRSLAVLSTPIEHKLCAIFRGENKGEIGELTDDGCFFGTPLKKQWTSPWSDLGYGENLKKIMSITLKPNSRCNITLESDIDKVSLTARPTKKVQSLPVNLVGKMFKMTVTSLEKESFLSCPELSVKVFM